MRYDLFSCVSNGHGECVLQWIKSKKDLSVFVRNRGKDIREHDDIVFRHIVSKDDPADVASRGSTSVSLMKNKLWWTGPHWSEQEWQCTDCNADVSPCPFETHEKRS